MKFFICGCNGMAGHTIGLYFQEQGHEVYGFDLRESQYIKSFAGNAFDTETIAKVIKEGKYNRKAALALTISGSIGAVLAYVLIKYMFSLHTLTYIICVVMVYTAYTFLRDAIKNNA